jgi:hypothetical protein
MTRIALISTTAIASILGAALPAFAQAPAPAPMYAPAPAPAPMMAPAPAPMPEPGVMPAAPIVAPPAADDMTGSVGLGVGVVSTGTSLVNLDTANLMLKYWMSDSLTLVPRLSLGMSKAKGADASWGVAPEILASFVLLKGASTRLAAGIGLGFSIAKNPAVSTDTAIDLYIPIQLSVEHFFTRWFSMGIAIDERFLDFNKPDSNSWTLGIGIDTLSYMGSLTFYTD